MLEYFAEQYKASIAELQERKVEVMDDDAFNEDMRKVFLAPSLTRLHFLTITPFEFEETRAALKTQLGGLETEFTRLKQEMVS